MTYLDPLARAATCRQRPRRHGWRGLAATVTCLASGAACAGQQPLWELGAGVGALRLPHYRGSDQSHNWLLPVPYLIYRGQVLKADRDGARAVLFESERVHFNLSVAASAPTRSSDNLARQGMPDLVPTVELGPNLNLRLAGGADWKLDFRVPVRAALTVESNPRSIGWIASPNLNLDLRRADGWNIGMQFGMLVADRRFNAFFYDVDASQATAQRPAYQSAGGFGGTQLTLASSRRFDNYWIGAFARADNLSGARFEDSPLVRQRSHLSVGIAIAWVFGRSSTMVTVEE